MRLIRFDEPGPPKLQCLDVPVPEPKSGEVLIGAHAIGVGIRPFSECLLFAQKRTFLDTKAMSA